MNEENRATVDRIYQKLVDAVHENNGRIEHERVTEGAASLAFRPALTMEQVERWKRHADAVLNGTSTGDHYES